MLIESTVIITIRSAIPKDSGIPVGRNSDRDLASIRNLIADPMSGCAWRIQRGTLWWNDGLRHGYRFCSRHLCVALRENDDQISAI